MRDTLRWPIDERIEIEIVPDHEMLSARSAQIVVDTLHARPDAVISFTTGRTVAGLYRALCALHHAGAIDLGAARLVSSEEYAGIGADGPISLFGWLRRDLLEPCGLSAARVLHFSGDAPDLATECRRFDATLARWGGLDLVVQSVGANGHFGFNEPGATPDMPSRPVRLAHTTLESNSAYWPRGSQLPPVGLTMGAAQTIGGRHVLLLAHGGHKAQALAQALLGPVDNRVPCSLLRLAPRLTVLAEVAAARDLGPARYIQPPAALPPVDSSLVTPDSHQQGSGRG